MVWAGRDVTARPGPGHGPAAPGRAGLELHPQGSRPGLARAPVPSGAAPPCPDPPLSAPRPRADPKPTTPDPNPPAPSEARKRAIHFKTKTNTDRMPRAVFDQSELESVRAPRPAGLALLGFKPAAALAPRHTLATARFVYPDERRGKGSTAAFVALHKAMIDAVRAGLRRGLAAGGRHARMRPPSCLAARAPAWRTLPLPACLTAP